MLGLVTSLTAAMGSSAIVRGASWASVTGVPMARTVSTATANNKSSTRVDLDANESKVVSFSKLVPEADARAWPVRPTAQIVTQVVAGDYALSRRPAPFAGRTREYSRLHRQVHRFAAPLLQACGTGGTLAGARGAGVTLLPAGMTDRGTRPV
jgi:hypothetical protein